MLKVGVIGALGKMGQEVIRAVERENDMEIAFIITSQEDPKFSSPYASFTKMDDALSRVDVDVIVDFTNAEAFRENAPTVLKAGKRLISGTTGLSHDELEALGSLAKESGTVFFYASNFAIGAVLMMRFAEEAAKYMPEVEIIERHHDNKKDAPSGTAISTLKRLATVREEHQQGFCDEKETILGSRGGIYEGMRVHSVRLPGYNAHQEIIFGGLGQTLVIRHDSINRESFMPGVILAIRKTENKVGFIENLDSLMEF